MGVLPENSIEQVKHKIQNQGGIKSWSASLCMVDSLCNCRTIVKSAILRFNVALERGTCEYKLTAFKFL